MDNTINCPHCGKAILSTAKKCKHCGEWLEKECPACGEWIKVNAKKCKHCGTWFNKFSRERIEGVPAPPSVPQQEEPTEEEIEEYIDEENAKNRASCLMQVECGIVNVILAYCYDWNWWACLAAVGVCYVMLNIRVLRILYCIAISLVWAAVGFVLAPAFVDSSDLETLSKFAAEDYSGYWWGAAILGIVSIVLHWPAIKHGFDYDD